MNRNQASQFTRMKLDSFGLKEWHVRLTTDLNKPFLGLCDHLHKSIILNAHHIDIHPEEEVIDTILHELAHALVGPWMGHGEIWKQKARELGCSNTLPCSHLTLDATAIDAIRSGATLEVEVEEHIIRTPKYKVIRIQDLCPTCGKVAKELFVNECSDSNHNTVKLITLECGHIIQKIIPKPTAFDEMVSNSWQDEVKSCQHEWNKNQCIKCEEFRLMNFQIEGARFTEVALATQKGAGIFDDMGLGKTIQALALVKFHKQYTPVMIVTKSAVTFQWFKQVIRWLGPDYIPQIIKTGKDIIIPGMKVYIISYDLIRRLPEKLHELGVKLVILDECQQIKNPDSSRTGEVRQLIIKNEGCKVLPLSGTPWKNRGNEFFPVLNMIDPVKFPSYQQFLDKWVDKYYDGRYTRIGGIRNVNKFKEYVNELLIRREYNEVIEEFPEINRMKLQFQLDEFSQNTYEDEESEFTKWYNEYIISGEEDSLGMKLVAKLARMRHIIGLAKIPATLGFIDEFIDSCDRKLVIFVHHKDVGSLIYNVLVQPTEKSNPLSAKPPNEWKHLYEKLKDNKYEIFKYTSELNSDERGMIQQKFNDSPKAIMIASTLACGEGVDLQTCADAVMHERQWNPQNEDQAAPGRFRRIGQKSTVINITFPEAVDTIEEHLDGIVSRKRIAFHSVMNKGEMSVWNESEIVRELAESIVKRNRNRKELVTK